MNEKYLVNISVPIINEKFDIFIPKRSKVNNIIYLIIKLISSTTERMPSEYDDLVLFNKKDGVAYDGNMLIQDTSIENGSELIII